MGLVFSSATPTCLIARYGGVYSVAFSPDGRWLAAGCENSSVCLIATATGGVAAALKVHSKAVNAVAFTADGGALVSGSEDTTARMTPLAARVSENAKNTVRKLAKDYVYATAVAADAARIVVGGDDNVNRGMQVWDPEGKCRQV